MTLDCDKLRGWLMQGEEALEERLDMESASLHALHEAGIQVWTDAVAVLNRTRDHAAARTRQRFVTPLWLLCDCKLSCVVSRRAVAASHTELTLSHMAALSSARALVRGGRTPSDVVATLDHASSLLHPSPVS
jgi:hypothetical protein